MAIIFPIVIMFVLCAIYAGAYVWMRRPKFGESEGPRKESIDRVPTDVDPRSDHEPLEGHE
ncbi:MAG: pilus assembly protein [Acidobacteria bacterium]|nr:pilus assembly protein [Acidobacteriota bacterium]